MVLPKPPLTTPPRERAQTPALQPDDHVRMLVALLKPAGPELARRWLATLLLAPETERPALVEEMELRMTARGGSAPGASAMLHVREAPRQRDGHVEQIVRSYASSQAPPAAARDRRDAR